MARVRLCLSWVCRVILVAWCAALVLGCGQHVIVRPNLPPPSLSTTVGPGDVFEVSVQGEKDLPKEFRVQPDGTIEFPYVDRLTVGGLEPQQIEDLIRNKLIENKVLVAPEVTLVVKQYNSKKVSIVGAVQRPGSFPWTEGMRLIDAISLAGGLTSLGDGDRVRITRVVSENKTLTATVSFDDISDGKMVDVLLQAGDTIKVEQRIF